jgi:hypothetical protein
MNALYYPYINVPKEDWTFQTLLYWDKLHSIVPSNYINEPERLSYFMRDLVHEGLVEQVFPLEYLHNCEKFYSTFINYVEKKYLNNPKKLSGGYSKIHIEKINELVSELLKMRLIFPAERDWWFIDNNVSNDYMAYLASFLGSKTNSLPVSNFLKNAKLFDNSQTYNKKLKIKNTILKNVIPIPENMSINSLLKFRTEHKDLLPKFRNYIDAESYKLVNLDKDIREYETKKIIDNIHKESEELKEALKRTFGKSLKFGNLLTIFSLTQVAISTYQSGNDIAFIGSLSALGGDIITRYTEHSSQISDLERKPLAYISYL